MTLSGEFSSIRAGRGEGNGGFVTAFTTRPPAARLFVLLLPILLAACQAPQGPPSSASGLPSRPAAIAEPPHIAPPPGAAAAPTLAELAADPARFKGLTGPDVTTLLGAPSFQRHDGEAEIWQYYGPSSSCVLDLFVYPDGALKRVAHAELRSRGASGGNGCLAAIVDGKRG